MPPNHTATVVDDRPAATIIRLVTTVSRRGGGITWIKAKISQKKQRSHMLVVSLRSDENSCLPRPIYGVARLGIELLKGSRHSTRHRWWRVWVGTKRSNKTFLNDF